MLSALSKPWVQIVALAAVVGGLIYFGNGAADTTPAVIDVTEADIAEMTVTFERTWRRPPEPRELDRLIEAMIRQEILVREALKRDLDRGDPVIRQRLEQNMRHVLRAGVLAAEPTEAELEAHLAKYPARFELPGQLAFSQVYLGRSLAEGELDAALAALKGGADPATVGEPTLLPVQIPATAEVGIDARFGRGFAERLSEAPLDQWSGPVASSYGAHLVRVTGRTSPAMPALADVRERVLEDWRDAQAEVLMEAEYQALAKGYEVRLENAD
ncbi:MAG: peptidylprolyl isomerase [Pseudomonadota bacterium]